MIGQTDLDGFGTAQIGSGPPLPITYPDGVVRYTMKEALNLAGISRSTYLRWVAAKKIRDTIVRNRNGWRLFTQEELNHLKAVAFQVSQTEPQVLKFEVR